MIKVGDWVKREHADGIARVISIEEDMAVLYTGGVQSCEYLEELTKLPIKFKGFESHEGGTGLYDFVAEQRVFAKGDETATFHALKTHGNDMCHDVYFVKGFHLYPCPLDFHTIEEAKDWLEHQYATMIAKARGLV